MELMNQQQQNWYEKRVTFIKKKHKLSKTSQPYEFAEAFLSCESNYNNKDACFSFANLTSWPNSEAM